jgi:broad specificity phosphatase PhoE
VRRVYFITHPNVVIDAALPLTRWTLSPEGRARMRKLLAQPWIRHVGSIYCSTEQKAIDGAEILAENLSLGYEMIEGLGEIDRSSTGLLPTPGEYQDLVDSFFRHPDRSTRGWETARHAHRRIVNAISNFIKRDRRQGDLAIVSHGQVGALYLCHLRHCPISRREGQPGSGGGNYYCFDAVSGALLHGWRPIDS